MQGAAQHDSIAVGCRHARSRGTAWPHTTDRAPGGSRRAACAAHDQRAGSRVARGSSATRTWREGVGRPELVGVETAGGEPELGLFVTLTSNQGGHGPHSRGGIHGQSSAGAEPGKQVRTPPAPRHGFLCASIHPGHFLRVAGRWRQPPSQGRRLGWNS
jgi:hypothetical protein